MELYVKQMEESKVNEIRKIYLKMSALKELVTSSEENAVASPQVKNSFFEKYTEAYEEYTALYGAIENEYAGSLSSTYEYDTRVDFKLKRFEVRFNKLPSILASILKDMGFVKVDEGRYI